MNRMELRKKQIMIASNILGFLTIIVLGYIIGDLGITYFAAAVEVYMLMHLIFTMALPDVVARFFKSRIAKGQYKNAGMVIKAAAGYGIAIGLIGSLLLLALSGVIAGKVLGMAEATGVIRIFAPLFLVNAICSVFLGYFQGIKMVVPTMIFAVIKEIFGLIFAVIFGIYLHNYGEKVSALLHSEKYASLYGAEGAAAGMFISMLFVLCFLSFLYFVSNRKLKKNQAEGMRRSEDAPELVRRILLSVAPVAVLHFLTRAEVFAGLFFFGKSNTGNLEKLTEYGSYYSEFFAVTGILITIGMLVTCAIEGVIVQAYKKEEYKNTRDFLQKGIQALVLVSFYFAGLFPAIGPSLFKVLFKDDTISSLCMSHGFFIIVFFPMGIFFSRILMNIGKKNRVLLAALASFVASVVVMALLQKRLNGSVLIPLYGQLVFALVFCGTCGVMLFRLTHYNPEWIRIFALPALASAIMGLGIILIRKALVVLVGDLVTCLVALIAGTFCYLVLIFVFRCIRKKDLYMMPGNKFLEKMEKIFHIFG